MPQNAHIDGAIPRRPMAILVVDDDADFLGPMRETLESAGHHVTAAGDGAKALGQLEAQVYDLVITDVRLPILDGWELLRHLCNHAPATDVILSTAYGSVKDAVAAIKDDAFDYLTKPFEIGQLLRAVDRVAERRMLRAELSHARAQLAQRGSSEGFIGRTPAMLALRERIAAIAESDAAVLITGESGTGKELVARTIHAQSTRCARAFVAVNCAAFPRELIESELFGHVRGAFTGAVNEREGRFAAADGGTLFLDEITEMPLESQGKLLRVLQAGTYERVGTNTTSRANVRLVSASNRDLKAMIGRAGFREDLYFRVKVFELTVPPLRQRPADLPLLVEHFLRRYTPAEREVPAMTPHAWAALRAYRFPGNVRELEHAIQHGVVLARGDTIAVQHLPDEIRGGSEERPPNGKPVPLAESVRRFERDCIERALDSVDGHRTRAAELLGISRRSLWRKLRDYAIDTSASPAEAEPEAVET